MIGWLWRKLTGRGTGPSRNRSLSRAAQREQIVRATVDLWSVEHKRGSALDQIDRFEAMSRGYDGGPLSSKSKTSLRKAHYKGWSNSDFSDLVAEIRAAIEKAESLDSELETFKKGDLT